MLTIEQFEGLTTGDLIEAVPLLPGIPGNVMLNTNPCDAMDLEKSFAVSYLGISLGDWHCKLDIDTLKWRFK